jgi:DNA-binding transcriptional ArsR family regulator
MPKVSQVAYICKILSVETRVQLLRDRALCVGALSARLDVTQGAVSQHLRILRDAHLVIAEKRGYYVHYRVNKKTLNKCKGIIETLLTTEAD